MKKSWQFNRRLATMGNAYVVSGIVQGYLEGVAMARSK